MFLITHDVLKNTNNKIINIRNKKLFFYYRKDLKIAKRSINLEKTCAITTSHETGYKM